MEKICSFRYLEKYYHFEGIQLCLETDFSHLKLSYHVESEDFKTKEYFVCGENISLEDKVKINNRCKLFGAKSYYYIDKRIICNE